MGESSAIDVTAALRFFEGVAVRVVVKPSPALLSIPLAAAAALASANFFARRLHIVFAFLASSKPASKAAWFQSTCRISRLVREIDCQGELHSP